MKTNEKLLITNTWKNIYNIFIPNSDDHDHKSGHTLPSDMTHNHKRKKILPLMFALYADYATCTYNN